MTRLATQPRSHALWYSDPSQRRWSRGPGSVEVSSTMKMQHLEHTGVTWREDGDVFFENARRRLEPSWPLSHMHVCACKVRHAGKTDKTEKIVRATMCSVYRFIHDLSFTPAAAHSRVELACSESSTMSSISCGLIPNLKPSTVLSNIQPRNSTRHARPGSTAASVGGRDPYVALLEDGCFGGRLERKRRPPQQSAQRRRLRCRTVEVLLLSSCSAPAHGLWVGSHALAVLWSPLSTQRTDSGLTPSGRSSSSYTLWSCKCCKCTMRAPWRKSSPRDR